jgi:hypothetical protein
MYMYFTILAFIFLIASEWGSKNRNAKDRKVPPQVFEEAQIGQAVVHTRQDIRLISFLLGSILMLLGIIADRLGVIADRIHTSG